jgi:molybdopterin-containing oxidoreductase family membrane subunit
MIVVYGYIVEAFVGWYSGSEYEIAMLKNRFVGPYAWAVYLLVFCNAITIQLLWFKKVRTNLAILFVISIIINTGMFLERFMIVVISLTKDYMPSAWGNFIPTTWDWGILIGSIGFFLVMLFIFVRALPMISIFEVRELLHDTKHKEHAGEAGAEAGAEA